ncbi:MAG: 2-dehydro-3-deoxygalactonokinase [Rhodospirillaceae bacterium]|jgi:2-dehydro-3-deoxygalactonokinase|nr:2-dehydro-3-deoxygalactonokinase [Rhodospirillaceae bacterium]MBT4487108.1 2-dehydro-3-deoxygalactonokinase [Rhodospirillaceae bacterium]MBT5195365.1 2-dehydro-3-deoxygalactonokinase [Rhodospirillaceae bacterium]MBT5894420.1 2-dehydro-3-deoxygalactonokinase [Rhodospirillaceae bacterium]MBT6427899.1 2-dehydro-3-deoxygalactonokinase [Rhodospirillaceae bacterium]
MPPKVALLGLDWGTTTLRGYLIGADGKVQSARTKNSGILQVEDGNFGAALNQLAGDWLGSAENLPIIASGMIGSRQGWMEVPYVELPAGPEELIPMRFDDFDRTIHMIPGLAFRNAAGIPDVMRGEETQIAGVGADGIFLMPGSHSKWVLVVNGRITWFATFMTGELFAALKDHTILGRMMAGAVDDSAAFARGVKYGHGTAPTLQSLFSARSLALFGDLPEMGVASYLSGLLIGAEIAEAHTMMDTSGPMITIIGEADLAGHYERALSHCGFNSQPAPQDAAARGHWRIATAAGLLN